MITSIDPERHLTKSKKPSSMIEKKKAQSKKPQNIAWSKPGIFKSQTANTFSDKELDPFPLRQK